MPLSLYLPQDEFSSGRSNFDLSADYLELLAFFSDTGQSFTKELVNASEIGAEEDYADVDEEVREREEIVSGSLNRISHRQRALGSAYPFQVDEAGDVISYISKEPTKGQGAYILCLVLSHLKSMTPVLEGSSVYPSEAEIIKLRQYFQYFATAALAAEINGQAWSFGHPRPDGTNFKTKLEEIWHTLRDGSILPARGAPTSPQDDQIDIFAVRMHADGLPGFLMAAAQVATGKDWKSKTIKSHIADVFPKRWFGEQPVTTWLCYQVIPFTRTEDEFIDDVRVLGNVLHRLRVPNRVEEASALHLAGVAIEAFDKLQDAVNWLTAYARRGFEAA